ncbi:MAG: hypothetical protein AAGD07_03310 [Planctomycetota bacterium]
MHWNGSETQVASASSIVAFQFWCGSESRQDFRQIMSLAETLGEFRYLTVEGG